VTAQREITRNPAGGLPAPQPYPELARPEEAWLHVGRYWFGYTVSRPPMILFVFYDAADIPGRR